jgi:uncharacterized lipoprotein YmbA
MKSSFIIESVRKNWILLGDTSEFHGGKSITNDAENVVEWVLKNYCGDMVDKKPYRIFYIDTDRRVDELIHDGSRFVCFQEGWPSYGDFMLDDLFKEFKT